VARGRDEGTEGNLWRGSRWLIGACRVAASANGKSTMNEVVGKKGRSHEKKNEGEFETLHAATEQQKREVNGISRH